MIGFGTILNTAAIVAGGMAGRFVSKLFHEEQQESLTRVCGLSCLFLAIAGAMAGMLSVEDGVLTSGKSMLVSLSLALGTIIGELLGIEDLFERFGAWLKVKSGNSGDPKFIDAFVTASLTVCIGAMAIVGSIEDGISGDYSILAVKSMLDCLIIAIMTSSMGKGCAFSAIPVLIFQGTFTVLGRLIAPLLTDLAISYLSMVGSILIFCVGINLVWGKRMRVANMLPAVLLAALAAYLPVSW